MIPDYPLGRSIAKQINENRMDIEPNLAEAILSFNLKNNLEKDLKEKYDVVNIYYKLYPEIEQPTEERIEHLLREMFPE